MTAICDTDSYLLQWIRPALAYLGYSEPDFSKLADLIGVQAAAEILLLMIARRTKTPGDTQTAASLDIPWQTKTWSGISKLQQSYNEIVTQMTSIPERPVLSDSSSSTRPADHLATHHDESVPRSLLADATGSPAGPWDFVDPEHSENEVDTTVNPAPAAASAQRARKLLTVYSVGWSEVPDHYQELDMANIFDIESDGTRDQHESAEETSEDLPTAASSAIAPPGDEPSTEERPRVLHRWLSLSQAQYVRYLHRRLVLLRRGLRLAEILLLGEASWSRLGPGQPRTSRPGIFQGGPLPKRPPPMPPLVCALCGDYAPVPFRRCTFCGAAPAWHHGRCCPAKTISPGTVSIEDAEAMA